MIGTCAYTKKRVSVALRRNARNAKGGNQNTENLKGRPGQGYYIALEIGTPPQRVRPIF